MPNKHLSNPVPFRPLPGQHEALKALAGKTPKGTVNGLLREAVADLLDKYEGRASPGTRPDPGMPPCPHPSAAVEGNYCNACGQDID